MTAGEVSAGLNDPAGLLDEPSSDTGDLESCWRSFTWAAIEVDAQMLSSFLSAFSSLLGSCIHNFGLSLLVQCCTLAEHASTDI